MIFNLSLMNRGGGTSGYGLFYLNSKSAVVLHEGGHSVVVSLVLGV